MGPEVFYTTTTSDVVVVYNTSGPWNLMLSEQLIASSVSCIYVTVRRPVPVPFPVL